MLQQDNTCCKNLQFCECGTDLFTPEYVATFEPEHKGQIQAAMDKWSSVITLPTMLDAFGKEITTIDVTIDHTDTQELHGVLASAGIDGYDIGGDTWLTTSGVIEIDPEDLPGQSSVITGNRVTPSRA